MKSTKLIPARTEIVANKNKMKESELENVIKIMKEINDGSKDGFIYVGYTEIKPEGLALTMKAFISKCSKAVILSGIFSSLKVDPKYYANAVLSEEMGEEIMDIKKKK